MEICIIGAFGFDIMPTGGQPVKTRNLFYLLSKIYGKDKINCIETYGWAKHPIKLFDSIKKAVKKSDIVIMLPANNGVKVFGPLLLKVANRSKTKIYYDVIGGWLPDMVNKDKVLAKTLKCFDGIWVETNNMKNTLEKQGFKNVFYLPNFKFLTQTKKNDYVTYRKPYKVCTFSRVMKEKGIEDAIRAVAEINDYYGEKVYLLDIYGPIDELYSNQFKDLCEKFSKYVSYKGIVEPDKSVEVIEKYFLLLFPTYYEGEGFAGTLLDTLYAGVPAIVSDWRYNTEIINEDIGFVFQHGNYKEIVKILDSIKNDVSLVNTRRKKCLDECCKYDPEKIKIMLTNLIENNR